MNLTRAQRKALKAVYDRGPLIARDTMLVSPARGLDYPHEPLTYREFRRHIRPYFGGDCILVPWQGMWLGIERDGYTHS